MKLENSDIYENTKSVDPQDGFVYEEKYLKNGELHRDGGPALIRRSRREKGQYTLAEEWWLEGIQSRVGSGPVRTLRYMPHDIIAHRIYLKDGKLISEDSLANGLREEYGLNID